MVDDGVDRSMDEMVSLTMKQLGDSTDTTVRPQSCVLALPSPPALAGDKEEEEPVLGGGDQADDGEEDEESYDSDDSYDEDESDDEVEVPIKIDSRVAAAASGVWAGPPLLRGQYVPDGRSLEPTLQFASSGNTAGFLGVAVVVPPPADRPAASQEQGGGKDKEILVLYRYTEFEAAPDLDGVEVSKKTMLHYLHFVVPPAGDVAGSLQWAWSSLASLIYPARHNNKLQELWSELVTNMAVGIPPGTTRLEVIADVGILRLEDYRYWRMYAVTDALRGIKAEPWPGYHVGMELRLPEPVHVQCADEDEAVATDCERPTKRRKIVTEEGAAQKCPVCLEPLESDAASWPGCSSPHVFHGTCLEGTLKESEKCPICRRRPSAQDEEVRAEA
ncbi:hypothetical protein CFC21_003297 [Triticum aestivum]|uniref:RING-type domain-containing protein n=1 Tax=Triticum aestivum TaxID=4565 RepID=A0A3B5Y3Q6_WHEAT|nr:hypothetical protein CFC21_003297 [Triticum aestivum]